MRWFGVLAVCGLFGFTSIGQGTLISEAQADTPCAVNEKAAKDGEAKALSFDMTDEKISRGLQVSLSMGLTPVEFPWEDVEKAKDPCVRGTFKLGNRTFSIYGDDKQTPPRWASSPDFAPFIAYMAYTPTPRAAYEVWAKKNGTFKPNEMVTFEGQGAFMVVLAIADKEKKRLITAFFDKIPSDKDLARYMCGTLSSEYRFQAVFEMTEPRGYSWGEKIDGLTVREDADAAVKVACANAGT
jgi:hypothetical protein